MVKPTIEVKGARELRRAIKKAQDTDLKAELKKANRDAADIVADQARIEVPRLSGTLAGSIRPSGLAASAVVRAGRKSVPYAGVIHFGWPARNIQPQPFLYDAADSRVSEVTAQYEDAINAIARRLHDSTRGVT